MTTKEDPLPSHQDPHVSRQQVLMYATMVASANVMGSASAILGFAYMTQVFGLGLSWYLAGNVAFLFVNLFVNVMFGVLADRTKHRLGRRIPYIRYGSLFMILVPLLLWFPWPGTLPGDVIHAQELKLLQFLVASGVSCVISTILGISLGSWVPEAVETEAGRTGMAIAGQIGSLISGVAAPIIPFLFQINVDYFRFFMLFGGVFQAIVYLLGSYVIRERPELYRESYGKLSFFTIVKELGAILKQPGLMASVMFLFFQSFVSSAFSGYTTVVGYGMGIDGAVAMYLVWNGFWGAMYVMYLPLRRWLKQRPIEKVLPRVIAAGMVLTCIFASVMWVFNLPLALGGIVLVAGGMQAISIFDTEFFGNLVDAYELDTNLRKESFFGAARSLFFVPLGQVVSIIMASLLLGIGYDQGAGLEGQTDAARIGIRLFYVILPLACGSLSLLGYKLFPFKGKRLIELKNQVHALHEKKAQYMEPGKV